MKKYAWLAVIGTLLIVGVIGYFGLREQTRYHQAQLAQQQAANNLDLQTKCASQAANYFSSRGYKNSDGFTYENHFDSNLNKCFVLISGYTPNDDFLSIDLYDAVGGQRYATYNGHQICDSTTLALTNQLKKCQLDSGNIWFDGNDTKPADFTVGFRGLNNGGGTGDQNTLPQFMQHIQPFMSN